jgi:HRAS-like suppressor 3
MTSGDSEGELPVAGRFEPGSHLRVRRRWGYMHHGIYVHNDRVIQFGGRIKDKPNATISAVSLAVFENGGVAEAVVHGRPKFFRPRIFLPHLPDEQPTDKVIKQAEWLVANYAPGRYHLVGNNCENIANWCATGWYPESHQVRSWIGAVAVAQAFAMCLDSYRRRTSPTRSKWTIAAGMLAVIGVTAGITRNRQSKKFWQEYGMKWLAYERSLPADPG